MFASDQVGKQNSKAYNTFNRSPPWRKLQVQEIPQNEASFYSLANDKIIDSYKLKVCAYDKINIIKTFKLIVGTGRVENIVEKGDNAGYQHCLLFPQCFKKLFSGSL